MSTSSGRGGAGAARQITETSLPHFGAEIIYSMGVPNFYENFKDGEITDAEIAENLRHILRTNGVEQNA